jgi:hypothetical protein
MKHIWLFLPAAFFWWLASCTSVEPPIGGSEDPVFWADYSADSSSNELVAGENGIYLFTRVETVDSSVLLMSGAFANVDCPEGNCPGSLKFEFRNINFEPLVMFPDEIFGPNYPWQWKTPQTNPLALGTVAIQWVDPEGFIFRSDWYTGVQDSFGLRILESEPWETNERGEATWKMDVAFGCWLMDTVQQREQYLLGSAVIAVGYR